MGEEGDYGLPTRQAFELCKTRLRASESALREAQRKLAAVQDRYRTLYNLAPVGHLTIDDRGVIRQANDTALDILGVPRNTLKGRPLLDFVVEGDQAAFRTYEREFLADDTVHVCELRFSKPHGKTMTVQLHGRRVMRADESGVIGFIGVTDVTKTRAMHDELKRRNRELAALNQFARTVSDSLQFSDIISNLRNMLLNESEVAAGAIFTYDAGQNALRLEAHWGDAPFIEQFAALPLSATRGGLPVDDIFGAHTPFFVEDWRQVPLFAEVIGNLGAPGEAAVGRERVAEGALEAGAFLFVPMAARGQVQGAIWLFGAPGSTREALTADRSAYFGTVGQQAGIALRGARLFAEVRHGQERLRLLTRKIVSAQEEERRRVSRELHDEAGQLLTALKLSLEMLQEDLKLLEGDAMTMDAVSRQLDAAISLNERTMAHIRGLVHNLRPTVLDDLGLNSALEGLCHDFAQRRPVSVHYHQDVDPSLVLPASMQIVAYRFLQEALTNVSKHAQASEVRVLFQESAGTVRLIVEDDGIGFEMDPSTEGIGLLGMRERLESVGGRLEIFSRLSNGTRLVASIPVDGMSEKGMASD